MKYLDFDVIGMRLRKSKTTDLNGLIAGSKGYLAVRLKFDADWNGLNKAAVFIGGSTETAVPIRNGVAVMDDYTASNTRIGFYIVGQSADKTIRIQTNIYRFGQRTGGVKNGR